MLGLAALWKKSHRIVQTRLLLVKKPHAAPRYTRCEYDEPGWHSMNPSTGDSLPQRTRQVLVVNAHAPQRSQQPNVSLLARTRTTTKAGIIASGMLDRSRIWFVSRLYVARPSTEEEQNNKTPTMRRDHETNATQRWHESHMESGKCQYRYFKWLSEHDDLHVGKVDRAEQR